MNERELLMIPGPIEFDPAVIRAMTVHLPGHMAPDFIQVFGRALDGLKQVFLAPEDSQPFVVAGSGTLAMDMAAANLIEPGDRALVVNTGFFSDRFAAICARYGATVDQLTAELGDVVPMEQIADSLARHKYKLVTVTHVDTSTGVRMDVSELGRIARQNGALSVVDGVCATAGEEFRQAGWDIDIYLTASQKAVGVPPGLALLVASRQALEAFQARKTPVANYYADWANWLPIMQAYQARRPSYFATPAVNLVAALDVSVGQILAEGMEARFRRHQVISDAFKAAITALELKQVPVRPEIAANTLTAIYYPDGVDAGLLGRIRKHGVVVAGGLHPRIRDRYFRVGHMGVVSASDVLATVGAIERALAESGYALKEGDGLAAAQSILTAL